MAVDLLLIRHGKAEKKDTDKEDAKRQLTGKGIEEFKEFIPVLQPYLKEKNSVIVWTSPLVRAKETSALLTEKLDVKDAAEKEFLASGDFDEFLKEIRQLKEEDAWVVCIGHEPHLSDWAENLTGTTLPFDKGGAMAFRLNDGEETTGKRLWVHTPSFFQQTKEEAEQVKEVLLNQVQAMEKAYRDYRNNPYDPETTHQLRVSMRKMRGLLNFLKPVLWKETYRRINDALKDAGSRMGPLREVDVLIEKCGEMALEEPELVSDYAELFRFLKNRRSRLLRSRLSNSTVTALEEAIADTKEMSGNPPWSVENQERAGWQEFLTERLDKKMRKLEKQLKETDHSDAEASHQVRIQAKKVRYAAAGFEAWMPDEAKKAKKKAKKIQKKLGKVSDFYTNARLLEAYAEKAKEQSLKEDFRSLARFSEEKGKAVAQEVS